MVFTSSADGGSYICTGTLLNNGNSPKRQLFWSAAHCIEDQATAATLQTIWFYNTTQCYGDASTINQSVTVLTGGANILHRDAKRDTLLLELKRTPPAGVFYQGWSATPIANGSLGHDIHHPRGDAKKYSQGNVSAVGVTYDGHTALTRVDWPSAVVEGGSSGSGLLTVAGDGSYQLRGGLYGGPSYCGAPTSQRNDYFSDFSGVYSQISPLLRALRPARLSIAHRRITAQRLFALRPDWHLEVRLLSSSGTGRAHNANGVIRRLSRAMVIRPTPGSARGRGALCAAVRSVLAAGDFQQVVAELGLHRPLDHVQRRAEDHLVELADHLAGAERAQVAAVAAGGAGGMLAGDFGEVGTAFDGGLQFVALGFAGNQDVAGSGSGHGEILLG